MAQLISGASAPYLAEKIDALTTDANGKVNTEADLMAHAVLGAEISYAAGYAALTRASGVVMGEYIAEKYWCADTPEKKAAPGQEHREQLSLLGTLAAGLAGGMAGNSSAAAMSGAIAGKNAVENNSLNGLEGFGTGLQNNV
ncbi:VENN motif pre-toxin domain-containing protein [Pantoea anthophila]|uniref:VENN motif pre-toxin domain-containing protein n=1 Tax=Pantoea anthophila TaxID=470931 RepID=UPI002DB6BF56|nr:VENN motif pre-toxin domain-containing protein [Pantoea anthophila]MEB5705640.1 VENN motif pre-toxin domain-containing protein [Pantoea anthophila]MEB6516510.1 VENN motif pre-toxin domain-containing protein [Pantoea anthophila]